MLICSFAHLLIHSARCLFQVVPYGVSYRESDWQVYRTCGDFTLVSNWTFDGPLVLSHAFDLSDLTRRLSPVVQDPRKSALLLPVPSSCVKMRFYTDLEMSRLRAARKKVDAYLEATQRTQPLFKVPLNQGRFNVLSME